MSSNNTQEKSAVAPPVISNRVAIGMLACFCILAMLPGLWMGLHADDWFQVRARNLGQVLATFAGDWNEGRRMMGGFYRPIVRASFALDHAMFGLSAWGYHLTNGLLFGACTFGIYNLVRSFPRVSPALALTSTSILFVFNPLKNEALYWASGRTDLLGSLFVIWAVAYTVRSLLEESVRAAVAALALLILGILSKEVAYAGCLIIPMLALVLGRGGRRERYLLILGPIVIGALFFLLRMLTLGGVAGYATSGDPTPLRMLAKNYLAIASALSWPWQADGPALFSVRLAIIGMLVSAMLLVLAQFSRASLGIFAAMILAPLPMITISISPVDGQRVLILPLAMQAAFVAVALGGAPLSPWMMRSILVVGLLLGFSLQPDNVAITRSWLLAKKENHLLIETAFDYVGSAPNDCAIVFPGSLPRSSRRILNSGDSMMMAVLSFWMEQPGATWSDIWDPSIPKAGLEVRTAERTHVFSSVIQPWMKTVMRLRYDAKLKLEASLLERRSLELGLQNPSAENRSIDMPLDGYTVARQVVVESPVPPRFIVQVDDDTSTGTLEFDQELFSTQHDNAWILWADTGQQQHPAFHSARLQFPPETSFRLRSLKGAAYEERVLYSGIGVTHP